MSVAAPVGEDRQRLVWMAAALALPGATMFTLVNPALPLLQQEFRTDPMSVSWLVTGYLISSAVTTMLTGRLVAALGSRRTMALIVGLVIAGGIVAAVAPVLWIAVAGRCLQGASGALVPTGLTIIRHTFTERGALPAYATLSTIGAVGGGIGLLAGGPLAELLSPRAVFWAPALATAATAVLIAFMPVVGKGPAQADLAGIALSSLSICLLLTAVSFGRVWPLPIVVALGAVGALAAVGWVLVERRHPDPLIDLAVIRGAGNGLVLIVAILTGATMLTRLTTMPAFAMMPTIDGGLGLDPSFVGLVLAPTSLCVLLGGYVVRRTVLRLGPRRLMLIGALTLAAANALFLLVRSEPWQVAFESAVGGLGIGAILATTTPLVLRSTPLRATTSMLGAVAVARTVGSSLGAQLPVALLAAADSADPLGLSQSDHVVIAGAATVVMILAACCVSAIPGRVESVSPSPPN